MNVSKSAVNIKALGKPEVVMRCSSQHCLQVPEENLGKRGGEGQR
jgi:hypothetical protein